VTELAELVQTFRFAVWLTRTTSPGPTLSAPPSRTGGAAPKPATGGRSPAAGPPAAGARGTAPLGTAGSQSSGRPAPDVLGRGAFAECQGLELEADIKDLTEGGANDAVVRRAGRVKLVPLVLRRGMLVVGADPPGTAPGASGPPGGAGPAAAGRRGAADTELWDWLQGMVAGQLPVPRYDGTVEVRDPADRRVVARWVFTRGLPLKITGPQLDAKTGEIALESLTIAHEGLRMEPVS
jgi:hypothetical protein